MMFSSILVFPPLAALSDRSFEESNFMCVMMLKGMACTCAAHIVVQCEIPPPCRAILFKMVSQRGYCTIFELFS